MRYDYDNLTCEQFLEWLYGERDFYLRLSEQCLRMHKTQQDGGVLLGRAFRLKACALDIERFMLGVHIKGNVSNG